MSHAVMRSAKDVRNERLNHEGRAAKDERSVAKRKAAFDPWPRRLDVTSSGLPPLASRGLVACYWPSLVLALFSSTHGYCHVNIVLPTASNYTGLCACSVGQLPLRQSYGCLNCCGITYGCADVGSQVTNDNCDEILAGHWYTVTSVDNGSWGWADGNYLTCFNCSTTTTTAVVAATTFDVTTTTAASTAALSHTVSTTRAAITTNAATTSIAATTSTVAAVTRTYVQATSMGAAMVSTFSSAVSTSAPSTTISPTPIQVDGVITVLGPWTATAVTIFTSNASTLATGLARITVNGPVTIQSGATAIVELPSELTEPKRIRLIMATSISGNFDSITVQSKLKKDCTNYKTQVVSLSTLLAVDVRPHPTECRAAVHRVWLIIVIVFASLFGVGIIVAGVSISLERWKPEWSYWSRRRAQSGRIFDANEL